MSTTSSQARDCADQYARAYGLSPDLFGLAIPPSVQGRVLEEALIDRDGAGGRHAKAAPTTQSHSVHTTSTLDGRYTVTAMLSTATVGGRAYRYLDSTTVVRRE